MLYFTKMIYKNRFSALQTKLFLKKNRNKKEREYWFKFF